MKKIILFMALFIAFSFIVNADSSCNEMWKIGESDDSAAEFNQLNNPVMFVIGANFNADFPQTQTASSPIAIMFNSNDYEASKEYVLHFDFFAMQNAILEVKADGHLVFRAAPNINEKIIIPLAYMHEGVIEIKITDGEVTYDALSLESCTGDSMDFSTTDFQTSSVPEFSTIGILFTLMVALLGMFWVIKKK